MMRATALGQFRLDSGGFVTTLWRQADVSGTLAEQVKRLLWTIGDETISATVAM